MTDRPDKFFQGTEMPTARWWEALWSHPAGVIVAVGLRSGMTVIDLCSGDGWFTLQIAKVPRSSNGPLSLLQSGHLVKAASMSASDRYC